MLWVVFKKTERFRKLILLPSSGRSTLFGSISVADIYYRTTIMIGVYKL